MGCIKNMKAKRQTSANRSKAASDVQAIGSALSDLGQVAADQARIAGSVAADKAQTLAKEGREWAQPRLEKAGEVLAQAQQEAQQRGRKAAEQSRKVAKQKRTQIEDDYVPRIQRALQDAADAAKSEKPLAEKAQEVGKVTQVALSEPTSKKKAKRGGKLFGWVIVGSLAAGAGYMLWRRTQPVEDPWAEEYWDDATTPPPADVAEEAAEEEEAAEGADEVIGDVDPEDGRKVGEI